MKTYKFRRYCPMVMLLFLPSICEPLPDTSYEEIDVSAISWDKAQCDLTAPESAPEKCWGLYRLTDVLLKPSEKARSDFIRLALATEPFKTIITKATGKHEKLVFTYLLNLWFGGNSKFTNVFAGTLFNDRRLKTGYAVTKLKPYIDTTDYNIESDNCAPDELCVKGICRKDTHINRYQMITYVEKFSPLFEFTIFNVAITKLKGVITDYYPTFKLKTKFQTQDIYVTVAYKRSSSEYSPKNVETVYFSLKKNNFVGVDYICDDFSPANFIYMDGLKQFEWICGFSSKITLYQCSGRAAFLDVMDQKESTEKQETFINEILKMKTYSDLLDRILGAKKIKSLQQLWFSYENYFSLAFLSSNTKFTNGFVSFEKAVEASDDQLNSTPGIQTCDQKGQGFISVDFESGRNVMINQVNSLFDFTLITAASVRALMTMESSQIIYRTKNPWNETCTVDVFIKKSGNKITEIRYRGAEPQ